MPAEVRYRMLVEQIPAVTYIADFTADAPFLYVSPQIEQLLGFPVDSWIETTTSGASASIPTTASACWPPSGCTWEQAVPYEGEFRHARRGRARGLDLGAGHDHPRRRRPARCARRACSWT